MSSPIIAIIGGGAAGFFAALTAAEKDPSAEIIILEKTASLLTKVRISGGGRCNVTHSCFDFKKLTNFYPRGQKELLGPFSRFQPQDTMNWFASKNVALKIEKDGRIFPSSNQSQTIIDCFLNEASKKNIKILTQHRVVKIEKGFIIHFESQKSLYCDKILIATGGNFQGHELAASLGHNIISPVPSLFTFNIPESPFKELSGISLSHVRLTIPEISLTEEGPMLLTHFGFSGPSVLRLSAWGARYFYEKNYQVSLSINWIPQFSIFESLLDWKKKQPHSSIFGKNPFGIPKQLWKLLLLLSGFDSEKSWTHFSHQQLKHLASQLENDLYQISGKTLNKEEFVTAGGVDLKEVNFKTMESRIIPGLFFAGEVLNIDGITGGFNFQNAWTTGYLAGLGLLD